jgi:hypothetical protein
MGKLEKINSRLEGFDGLMLVGFGRSQKSLPRIV